MAKSGRWIAKLGRWVAKLGRRVAKLGRWVAKLGRWVAKLVARLLATAALWAANPDISQKHKIGDMSGQHTLARKKNIQKSSLKQEVSKKIFFFGGGFGAIWLP